MYRETALPARYHRQDTGDDCGKACGQMAAASFGTFYPQQSDLDGDHRDMTTCPSPRGCPEEGWSANPACLQRKLQLDADARSVNRTFNLQVCQGEEAISRWLVYDLFNGGVAPSVVVWGKAHWALTYACEITANKVTAATRPAKGLGWFGYVLATIGQFLGYLFFVLGWSRHPHSRSYHIKAFYAHDPAPDGPDPNGQAHTAADATEPCGTGIVVTGSGASLKSTHWGLASRRVRYKFWKERWLTGIPAEAGDTCPWVDHYLAVVDATGPNANADCPPWDAPPSGGGGSGGKPCAPNSDATSSDEALARTIAQKGLTDDGLFLPTAPEPWKTVLQSTIPGNVFCVQPPSNRMGEGFYYYLVEMKINDGSVQNGTVPVLVMVDLDRQEMLEAAAVRGRGFRASDFIRAEDIIAKLVGRKVILEKNGDPVELTQADFEVPPKIVWTHGPRSLSPYTPFYEFNIRGHYLFFRLDDRSILALTESPEDVVVDISDYGDVYRTG